MLLRPLTPTSWVRLPAVEPESLFRRRRPCMGWTRNPGTARLLGVSNTVCSCEGLRTSGGQGGQVTSFERLQYGHNLRICDCAWQQLEAAAAILLGRPEKVESWPPRLHTATHSKQQPETPSSLFFPSDKSVSVPWNYLMTLLAKTSQGSPQNH